MQIIVSNPFPKDPTSHPTAFSRFLSKYSKSRPVDLNRLLELHVAIRNIPDYFKWRKLSDGDDRFWAFCTLFVASPHRTNKTTVCYLNLFDIVLPLSKIKDCCCCFKCEHFKMRSKLSRVSRIFCNP